jgi:hypothetical protein
MSNRDIDAARRNHDATRHTYVSVWTKEHGLDWSNQPLPYKIYRWLDAIPLPTELPAPGAAAIGAITRRPVTSNGDVVPDLTALAYVLFCS